VVKTVPMKRAVVIGDETVEYRLVEGIHAIGGVRLPASTSFVAQRNHGIHTGGAAGWDVSGEHGDGQNSCWNHEV
jgi:hypothetical protein